MLGLDLLMLITLALPFVSFLVIVLLALLRDDRLAGTKLAIVALGVLLAPLSVYCSRNLVASATGAAVPSPTPTSAALAIPTSPPTAVSAPIVSATTTNTSAAVESAQPTQMAVMPTLMPTVASTSVALRVPSQGHVLGRPNAPVTVDEYGDFQ